MNYNEIAMDNEHNFEMASVIPHCPVMLVLDTSHSMWGRGLAEMMGALDAFFKTVQQTGFCNAQVDIAAVSMGDNLKMLEEFTPLVQSTLPMQNIRPKGDTPIGAALELALQKLSEQVRNYQAAGISYVTPHLILLSDGVSTDDFTALASRIRAAVSEGRLFCRAIATGPEADIQALARIAGENVLRPNIVSMHENFSQVGALISQTYEEEAPDVMIRQEAKSSSFKSATASTVYLLDGSNILHWDERNGISLDTLLAMTEYFRREGNEFLVIFDATARYLLRKSAPAEEELLERLFQNDPEHFRQVPAGTRADDFLLMQANENPEALILSQDLYRDYAAQYPWLKEKKRVIAGMVIGKEIYFPKIKLLISLNRPEKSGVQGL